MAKRILLFLLVMAAYVLPSYAEVRWIGKAEGEKIFGGWVKDVTGPRGKGYWAGEIEELEIDETASGMTLTGRVKVRITWVTPITSYECHLIYIMHNDNIEDFTHRSLMLKRCS